MVVRGDALGDPDAGAAASFRVAERRRRDCELPASPPPRRPRRRRRLRSAAGAVGTAEHLSARDLRPDGGVLADRAAPAADVPRDAHVPAAQELRLQSRRRTASLPLPSASSAASAAAYRQRRLACWLQPRHDGRSTAH